MELELSFATAQVQHAEVLEHSLNTLVLRVEDQDGGFVLPCNGFAGHGYFAVDMEMLAEDSLAFFVDFWKRNQPTDAAPDFGIICGLMPRLPATFAFDFRLMDSQVLFPYRTPGRMKMVVHGKRTAIGEMERLYLRLKASHTPYCVKFSNPRVTDAEPEYLRPKIELLDEMGQFIPRNWPHKQPSVSAMAATLQAQYAQAVAQGEGFAQGDWSRWGGWTKKRLTDGSGFFATHHDGRRHWLVDPDGYAYFALGHDCVGFDRETRVDVMAHALRWIPAPGEYPEAMRRETYCALQEYDTVDYPAINLMRAFGQEQWKQKWTRMTAARLRSWGFNSIGNWTDLGFCRASGLPYVVPLDGGLTNLFPTTKHKVFRDFPDVFSQEYRDNAQRYARQLEPLRGDPFLIGYFLCNEPQWAFEQGLNLGAEVLAHPAELATKEELIAFLQNRYGAEIAALNRAWGTDFTGFDGLRRPLPSAHKLSAASAADLGDFMGLMVQEYVRIPSQACRAVDPDHLNLGMRWAWIHDPRQIMGWQYVDVFSINCYGTDPRQAIEAVPRLGVDKPVLIGEYHFGALDGATPSTGLKGMASQAERGNAYRYYVQNGASTPSLVGCHYFTFNDQSAVGRSDGENYNIGFVDACHQPYDEMVAAAQATAAVIYGIADGTLKPFDSPPVEIPGNHY